MELKRTIKITALSIVCFLLIFSILNIGFKLYLIVNEDKYEISKEQLENRLKNEDEEIIVYFYDESNENSVLLIPSVIKAKEYNMIETNFRTYNVGEDKIEGLNIKETPTIIYFGDNFGYGTEYEDRIRDDVIGSTDISKYNSFFYRRNIIGHPMPADY